MKYQYLVFAGDNYYPDGGWKDFQAAFESREEAVEYGQQLTKDGVNWWEVVDINTLKIIQTSG